MDTGFIGVGAKLLRPFHPLETQRCRRVLFDADRHIVVLLPRLRIEEQLEHKRVKAKLAKLRCCDRLCPTVPSDGVVTGERACVLLS